MFCTFCLSFQHRAVKATHAVDGLTPSCADHASPTAPKLPTGQVWYGVARVGGITRLHAFPSRSERDAWVMQSGTREFTHAADARKYFAQWGGGVMWHPGAMLGSTLLFPTALREDGVQVGSVRPAAIRLAHARYLRDLATSVPA